MKHTFPYMHVKTFFASLFFLFQPPQLHYNYFSSGGSKRIKKSQPRSLPIIISPIPLLMSRFPRWTRSRFRSYTTQAKWLARKNIYYFSFIFLLALSYICVWHAKCLIFQHLLCKFIITSNIFIFIQPRSCRGNVKMSLNGDIVLLAALTFQEKR